MSIRPDLIRCGRGIVFLFLGIALVSCDRSTGSGQSHPPQVSDAVERNAPDAGVNKRIPIESCIIEYTGETEGAQASETVYFDEWGMRQVVRRTIEGKNSVKTLMILDEHWITNVDLLSKTGTRMAARYAKGSPGIEVILNAGEKVGSEFVAGKECDKWRLDNDTTLWVWNSIPLKTQHKKDGRVVALQTALEVKDNVSIPEEQFQIPPNVTIAEITKPVEVLKALGYQ